MTIAFPPRAARSFILAVAVVFLFGASVHHSQELGQERTLYDNPIYRWRESLAVALSRMQDKPLHGYLAYRSTRDYLAQHGLGLMGGEADPLPSGQERHDLVFDPDRMEELIREARDAPIDYTLPPVMVQGNELGVADYYYWSFKLFGLNLRALWLFYFSLLAVSAGLFFLTFRRSPFCILLLMLYLSAHYYMVGYAALPHFTTVHNSRFFPVLSILPAMHLMLLLVRRERATLLTATVAGIQTLLLMFIIFCRLEAAWQAMAVIFAAGLMVSLRPIWRALRHPRTQRAGAWRTLMDVWPATLCAAGVILMTAYGWVAVDKQYRNATRTHVFWHTAFAGLVSSSPELDKLYGQGQDEYGDNIAYMAALTYLREHRDVKSAIAYTGSDGQLYINPMSNMGAYDKVMRRVFIGVVAHHPWLVLKSFLVDKPRDQIDFLKNKGVFRLGGDAVPLALAAAASLLTLMAGASLPTKSELLLGLRTVTLVGAFSLVTPMIVPSLLIVGTIVFFLMIALLLGVTAPVALVWHGIARLLRAWAGRPRGTVSSAP
ncbi:MAG: hypothetical protein ACM30I_05175 [Gemmatimonas sp.]